MALRRERTSGVPVRQARVFEESPSGRRVQMGDSETRWGLRALSLHYRARGPAWRAKQTVAYRVCVS